MAKVWRRYGEGYYYLRIFFMRDVRGGKRSRAKPVTGWTDKVKGAFGEITVGSKWLAGY